MKASELIVKCLENEGVECVFGVPGEENMDRAPVVAITGQADRDRLHKESHQHLDIVALFRPVTKWNTSLPIPGIIPEVFRKAFKQAQSEKPGATHIEIPEDVARMETDGQPLLVQWIHPGGAAAEQIDKAAPHLTSNAPGRAGWQRRHSRSRFRGLGALRQHLEHPGRHDLHGQRRYSRHPSACARR